MTPFEWIAVSICLLDLIVLPIGLAVWKIYRDKVKNDDLRRIVDELVLAAEEKAAAGQIGDQQKYNFVFKALEKSQGRPFTADEQAAIDILIHASVANNMLGATGKK